MDANIRIKINGKVETLSIIDDEVYVTPLIDGLLPQNVRRHQNTAYPGEDGCIKLCKKFLALATKK